MDVINFIVKLGISSDYTKVKICNSLFFNKLIEAFREIDNSKTYPNIRK